MVQRTITIFGGAGFIGRHLVRRLAKSGWQIRVACRRPVQARFLKPLGDIGQITPVQASLRDESSVRAAVEGSSAVVNLVGILAPGGAQSFEAVQHLGAKRAAAAAAAAGAERFVQISAIGADPQSRSDYARTKALGEAAASEAFPGAAVLRPSIVFGPEDGFFNLFAGLARMLPFVLPVVGGATRFQPVYVGDVAEAIVACLERAETAGQTYELGGPEVHTMRELMEIMLEEIGRQRRLVAVPWKIAEFQASILERLPNPLLTRDQLILLRQDNVVAEGAKTLSDLGIEPTPMEIILPTYLDRYRPGGRFMAKAL